MDPGADKLMIYTLFLPRKLLGLRVKPECTPAVVRDGWYYQKIKTILKSREANQGDYIDVCLVSSDGTVPLHANFGAGSEICFSSEGANTMVSWNSSLSNLICVLVHIYLF